MKDRIWIVDFPKYTMALFIIFNGIAMYSYPGGNMNDPLQEGYSFIYNFFSDLGMTTSHQEPSKNNLISCLLFNSSLIIVGICFSMLFYKIKNIFLNQKILSNIATFTGVLSGITFIGVALTPSNIYLSELGDPWLHIIFAHWIFRLLFITSILYSILIIRTNNFDNKYAYAFISFGVLVFVYVLYSEFFLKDPRIYPDYLIKHVLAQKAVVLWILCAVYYYSIGVKNFLYND